MTNKYAQSPIPVIIPARNKAKTIERVLKSLPERCEPIVIVNGSTDDTEQILERLGTHYLVSEEPGKMKALQVGMQHLGKRLPEVPFFCLDADTWPIVPSRWLQVMLGYATQADNPVYIVGQLRYVSKFPRPSDITRTLLLYRRQISTRLDQYQGQFSNANVLIDFKGDAALLRKMLQLPNYWPNEDDAMKDVILEGGGKAIKAVSPFSFCNTYDARSLGSLEQFQNRSTRHERLVELYSLDAPTSSIPYERKGSF